MPKLLEFRNTQLDFDLDFRVKAMLDNPFEGIIAIDHKGFVTFINNIFLEILQKSEEDIIGRKIWEIIPTCRIYESVSRNHFSWGERLKLNDREMIVSHFPLKHEDKVIGAMVRTIFLDMNVAKKVATKCIPEHELNSKNKNLFTCMDVIGETKSMLYVKKLARKASRTNSNLLITGESGTGKEVIAQAVHSRSDRREKPFISVNCGAIPDTLLESELFGYVSGAFTGAIKGGKPGKFELANGGTILLDEIGDMPCQMQVKLLRVLQEREIWRIGATTSTKLDVRVMASTHQDLLKLINEHKFREDLYYRLNVLKIDMPPLRERIEDLPLLIEKLIRKINKRMGSDIKGIDAESIELLKQYHWPGNVRELENILEQAVNWSDEEIINLKDLPIKPWEKMVLANSKPDDNLNYKDFVDETERNLIVEALNKADGNKAEAARLLNMQRSVLYKKLKRLEI